MLYAFPLESPGLRSSQRTAYPKVDVRAPSHCGVSCQCNAKGLYVPRGWAPKDRQTYRDSCRPVCKLLAIKKRENPMKKAPDTLMRIFLLGNSLDCFISTFLSYSIMHIKLETYIFQSVLHNMSLIVWSKVAFSFVEWRRQMSLSPRMLVLSATCRAKMCSLLPGAHREVLYFQNLYLASIDIMWISLHTCETR